jgi:hypothetical protein
MASNFGPNDQRRIVRILNLHRDQRLPNSRLVAVMDIAEHQEAQGAVGLVDDILAILDAIDEADEAETGEAGEAIGPSAPTGIPDGVARIDIDRELSLTFQTGRSPGDGRAKTRAANLARLKQLLDPENQLGGVSEGGLILW